MPADNPPPPADELHVWHDGDEWYVASDFADLKKEFVEQMGDAEYFEDCPFVQLPDDTTIRIVCNEDGDPDEEGDAIERTCAEWCKRQGRGLLCSRNY